MEKTTHYDTDTERELDDVMCSSDFRNTCSYSSLQSDVADVFMSVQELINLPEYHDHIRGEACMSKMKDIDKQLDCRKNDLMKTDCAIVFAGETSAGKSTVINLIIGEDIFPMDITATTSRICRMKYSDTFQISTCDSAGRQIKVEECDDREDMAKKLSDLATTKDEEIKYIDVWHPLEILKGNVVIVDTPGIGDQDQEEAADMMMDYIPNALAFVFVVNMANAGGLQGDRLVRILERVRGSLNHMHSFDPEDAIFLLNKWDTLIPNPRKIDLFEETKEKLHDDWEDVEDKYILKFAAARVEEHEVYKKEFARFQQYLKTIIAKNENKRIKVHTEFTRSFIEDCDGVVLFKINCAKRNTEENVKTFDKLTTELEDIERTQQEEFGNLQQTIDEFLEETTRGLHEYIHSKEFKKRILQGKYSRFTIESEMDSQIDKETCRWQQKNMEEMFKRKIMKKITRIFINIHESLHTDKLKKLTSPFDVKKTLVSALVSYLASNGTVIGGSILMTQFFVNRNDAMAAAAVGLVGGVVLAGLVRIDFLDNIHSVIENTYMAKVKKLTPDKIKKSFTQTYARELENILQQFLDGYLKEEIDDLKCTLASMRTKVDYFQEEESNLMSLSSKISKIRNRLKDLENTVVKMD